VFKVRSIISSFDLLQSLNLAALEEKRRHGYPVHFDVYSGISRISISILKRDIEVRSEWRAERLARVAGFEVDIAIEKRYGG
jgi:hypothetical protein